MGDVFVEFFSEEALENIMTLLQYKPERIIYLGHIPSQQTSCDESLPVLCQRHS